MPDRRWILNSIQDWVDYVDENGVLLGSISPLQQRGVRACTYRPSAGWPLRYDKHTDFPTEKAARAWVEEEIEARSPVGPDDALTVQQEGDVATAP